MMECGMRHGFAWRLLFWAGALSAVVLAEALGLPRRDGGAVSKRRAGTWPRPTSRMA